MMQIPGKLEHVLAQTEIYDAMAKTYPKRQDFLYLGRGIHFPIALEGALKLKEISYIHAEGYPAGEMKHGPNALIDENLPVVVLATKDPESEESIVHYEKTLSNIQEVKARSGIVVAVACEGDEEVAKMADYLITIPVTRELLLPITRNDPASVARLSHRRPPRLRRRSAPQSRQKRHRRVVATFHVRRLPHHYATGQPVFLTWRLHGSLPSSRVFPAEAITSSGKAFLVMDRLLDGGRSGPLYLQRPDMANLIVEALRFRERERGEYQLHAWVVMANHVHILITPQVPISQMMQSLKRSTAREANRLLGLTGQPFWQEESFDRLVRNDTEFARIARYIEMNPVTAGLVQTPELFPWSSATR